MITCIVLLQNAESGVQRVQSAYPHALMESVREMAEKTRVHGLLVGKKKKAASFVLLLGDFGRRALCCMETL